MRNRELSTEMRNFINAFNNADIKLEKIRTVLKKPSSWKGPVLSNERIKLIVLNYQGVRWDEL